MSKVYLVTGANSGLGLDASRQLALRDDVSKVYLACRSQAKAEKAMEDLVANASVDKSKLSFVKFDGSDSKANIEKGMDESIPKGTVLAGLILNAGGVGDDTKGTPTGPNNIIPIAQINLAGHVHMINHLLKKGNIKDDVTRIVFSGTEGSRGIKLMGMPSPSFEEDTVDYFKSYLDGTIYSSGYDAMGAAYGDIKGVATLYFSGFARAHPKLHVLTVSPGGTRGTSFATHGAVPSVMGFIFPYIMMIMSWFGLMHSLQVGAKRYVDAVTGEGEFSNFASGSYIASKSDAASGPVADQVEIFESAKQYGDVKKQDAAYEAMNSFL
mmetsp:Transcript_7059/g.14473  ORF Transcript_7059/g.14473 Transcript_7059/m.14473 type:complete len:325 (-) Transcript_7059:61-1035(-)|eukprot:CAMPEP_0168787296 /NCGR_PEP_ID=MMETSP0725-20121227/11724_1 /TAXON_ID=265536 /ORGANISM="Amphiprora sp., Strain CCMP467" /LENGTH=324 /DNA_ID=CAMNT_0008837491 /DNA_START=46 /DNA_END=1020 /DNA_ORIENTATION=+